MKKILCFIDSLGPGGAQRQLVGLAILLKEQGYDVTVVCYHDNQFYIEKLQTSGVPYVYLKKAQKITYRLWHVSRFIRQMKPDVVISYLETPSICTSVAHILNRKFRLIVSERNTTQHTGWKEKIRFHLFRHADYIVPNAFAQADYINNRFPKLTSKTFTIPNFVDLVQFAPPTQRQQREMPEIIVVATIRDSKNTLGLIEAVALLKASDKRFHVSWYGKDFSQIDYFNQCQKKIEELNIKDCIELKDKTYDISEKYQEADYFCLPSFYEGTPNVICEAMACGLPVACSNICDNSRYVENKINGFLFDPKDVSSISMAIGNMLSLNDIEYRKYCHNSRERAENMLSKDRFVKSYVELIEQ